MKIWHIIIADRLALVQKYRDFAEDGSVRLISLVEQSLNKIGAQVYFPRERIAITRLNRRIKVDRSLLYSYAFVTGAEHHDIREAKGVYKLLEDIDGKVAKVSSRAVDRFKCLERYGEYDCTRRGKHTGGLRRGQQVLVVDGHWVDWKGVVERCGAFKAHVDMGSMVIEFPVDVLEAV